MDDDTLSDVSFLDLDSDDARYADRTLAQIANDSQVPPHVFVSRFLADIPEARVLLDDRRDGQDGCTSCKMIQGPFSG